MLRSLQKMWTKNTFIATSFPVRRFLAEARGIRKLKVLSGFNPIFDNFIGLKSAPFYLFSSTTYPGGMAFQSSDTKCSFGKEWLCQNTSCRQTSWQFILFA
jgi:hypothetical protein